jgi:ABC-type sugar transport system permease subunit
MSTTTAEWLQDVSGWIGNGREVLREYWFEYLLFVPTLMFLLALVWGPFVRGVWMSFHDWPLFGESTWVGLDNYAYLFGWDALYTSIRATIIFSLQTVLQLVVGLGAALALTRISSFRDFINGIYLIGFTMPPVVTGTMWYFLLHPQFGPIQQYLTDLGLLGSPVFWRSSGDIGIWVITLVSAWTFWPFVFLVLFASLTNIPDEHYETARVYGASRIQQFVRITLPQLKSAILVAISIRIVWNLVKVSQPLQMTGGGPGYETSILAILLYRFTKEQRELGLSFSVGVVLFVITLVFTVLFIREFERATGEGGETA